VSNEGVLTGRTSRPIPSAGIIPNLRVDLVIAAAMVEDAEGRYKGDDFPTLYVELRRVVL
jgi:hypothetical protein